MILRHATTDDESALESFDLGDIRSPWLDEVGEIVSGLIAWRDDVEHHLLDRQVVMMTVSRCHSMSTNVVTPELLVVEFAVSAIGAMLGLVVLHSTIGVTCCSAESPKSFDSMYGPSRAPPESTC